MEAYMNDIKVSVLMAVHNGEAFLDEAIDSILEQSFSDFEFIIFDDASTDKTSVILENYQLKDPRIKVHANAHNMGLAKTLNKGLNLCKGEYIARMDADDIAHPNRLARQIEYLDTHPQIGLIGSHYATIEPEPKVISPPESHREIDSTLMLTNCIGHPTIVFRRALIIQHDLAYPETRSAQDYLFFVHCAPFTSMANIPDILLSYRKHEAQISSSKLTEQKSNALVAALKHTEHKLQRPMSSTEKLTHQWLVERNVANVEQFREVVQWANFVLRKSGASEKPFLKSIRKIAEQQARQHPASAIWHYFKFNCESQALFDQLNFAVYLLLRPFKSN